MPHLLNENCDKSIEEKSEDDPLNMNPLSSSSSSSPPPPTAPAPLPQSTVTGQSIQPSAISAQTLSEQQKTNTLDDAEQNVQTDSSSPHKTLTPTSNPESNENNNTNNLEANTSSHSSTADDCDEIKVYNEEGAEEDEQRTSDHLTEEKSELIDSKSSSTLSSHPFSVNNLMLFNSNQSATDATASGSTSASLNPFLLGYRSPLYNPLYSPELANHFASWWPAAAAASALYNPANNPFSAFAYQQQQFAAAAALSRFNPGLFLNSAAAAAAAAAAAVKNEPGSSNPHSMPSSSSSSSSPFSVSSTTSNSSHKINQPLQNSKQFNHINKLKQEYSNSSRNQQQHQHQQQHHHNNHLMAQQQMSHSAQPQSHPPPPPPNIQLPAKSKKPHIKKPLNAFMLFMKEQRAKVVNECTLRESAAINQILGRKWHELDRAEQAKYYEMARQERLKHMQLYPGWSARDNYGLKKKRRRKREKVIGENGELPRKCRARYGLQQINLWCKPCRRKKKCIRFANNENADTSANGMNGVSPMIMGPNGQMYPNPMYNPMMNGDSGAGSLNGANSEDDYEDDYDDMGDELLPGGQEDETDDETDSEDDENELDDSKDMSAGVSPFGAAVASFNSPMYHPNKKPNLNNDNASLAPLSQIQHQFHQQFQQSMDSKNDLMQQIQQMQHQFQNGGHALNALNYSHMFNGTAANETALHTAAQN